MGVPVKNNEGYNDPTAAEAINKIELEEKLISVGCIVSYQKKKHKVEYVGWFRGELVVQLNGVSGLVPVKDIKKVK